MSSNWVVLHSTVTLVCLFDFLFLLLLFFFLLLIYILQNKINDFFPLVNLGALDLELRGLICHLLCSKNANNSYHEHFL